MLKGVPASAYKYVTWTTSNSSIVELEDNNPYIVKSILPKRSGTAIVTAKYRGKSYRCKISVSKVYATCKVGTQITRSQEYMFDPVGDIDEMSVSVANRFKTKTAQIKIYGNKSTKVKYMSSNSSVATVSRTGKVTFNGKGVARISAILYNKYTSAPLLDDFSFMITVNEPEVFTLNSAYQKLERAGYNKNSKIKRDVLKYINAYRRKNGLKNLKELSYLSHAAGYTMYAHPNTKEWFDAGDPCWEQMGTIVKLYARKNMLQEGNYIPLTGNLSAKKIAEYYINAKEHDMGYNNLLRLNYIGIYVDRVRGTFIYLGDFYNSGN